MANKSNKSAVVIIPPKSAWDQIQNIRSKYDKAYERWMPHINLMYPFAPDTEFTNLLPRLKEELQQTAPFTISFTKDSIGYFEHGQRCGLWLKPLLHSQQSCGRPTGSVPSSSQKSSVIPDKTNNLASQTNEGNRSVVNSNSRSSIPSLNNLRYAIWLPEDNVEDCNLSVVGLHNLRNAIWLPGESDLFSITSSTEVPLKVALNKSRVTVTKPPVQYSEKLEVNNPAKIDFFHPSVMNLQIHLQQLFPYFNDLCVINEKGFQPHLTLGQFKHNEIERVVIDLKQNWKPVDFKVDEIFLISRKGFSDPFEIRESVALGNYAQHHH